jgi:hypothetical protein
VLQGSWSLEGVHVLTWSIKVKDGPIIRQKFTFLSIWKSWARKQEDLTNVMPYSNKVPQLQWGGHEDGPQGPPPEGSQ